METLTEAFIGKNTFLRQEGITRRLYDDKRNFGFDFQVLRSVGFVSMRPHIHNLKVNSKSLTSSYNLAPCRRYSTMPAAFRTIGAYNTDHSRVLEMRIQ